MCQVGLTQSQSYFSASSAPAEEAKWISLTTALKATTIVFVILFVLSAFAIGGEFFPAGGLAFMPLPAAVITAIISLVVTGVCVYFLVRENGCFRGLLFKPQPLDHEMRETLNVMERELKDSVNSFAFDVVRWGLSREPLQFYNQYEYYTFHYYLTVITEGIKAKGDLTLVPLWEPFLRKIEGQEVIYTCENGRALTFDASVHLERLQDQEIVLVTEQLTAISEGDLNQIKAINLEAFTENPVDLNLLAHLQASTHCFVIRDANTGRILGYFLGNEHVDERGNKIALIHSLARRANAPKIKMTEHVKAYLQSHFRQADYAWIYCQVLADNHVAQRLYKKLGFEFWGEVTNGWIAMRYTSAAS